MDHLVKASVGYEEIVIAVAFGRPGGPRGEGGPEGNIRAPVGESTDQRSLAAATRAYEDEEMSVSQELSLPVSDRSRKAHLCGMEMETNARHAHEKVRIFIGTMGP
jgi:hypothetical protein